MAPSERGLSAKLTGGVPYPRRHTPSTTAWSPSPCGGGKRLSFIVVGVPVRIARAIGPHPRVASLALRAIHLLAISWYNGRIRSAYLEIPTSLRSSE